MRRASLAAANNFSSVLSRAGSSANTRPHEAVSDSSNVDVNGNVIGEEDFKDSASLLPAKSVAGFCRNSVVAQTGFSSLPAGGKTSHYDFVLRNTGPVARFAEDPSDGATTGS